MKKQKDEQIEKKIDELFNNKKSVQQITELHNSEIELLRDNPAKLRILYKFYENQLWKMYNDKKTDLYLLYKSLWEQTKEFAIKNYNFNEISTFFNN